MADETKASVDLTAQPIDISPEGVDITPNKDGGILKTIKTQGSGESGPGNGDKVFVHYVGTLADGTKFDSSRDRNQKFDFSLGQGSVIKGWDIGVATMKKGEVAVLTCRGDYAYGKQGSPPIIPANATLLFEVELFSWKGEDISPDSDETMLRSIIQKGEPGPMPLDGSTVKVHIIGRHDSKVFEDHEVEFVLGDGFAKGIVEGIEHALTKFKKNETSVITMKSIHAYGSAGCPEKNIPANADVEYEITLKEFEKVKEAWEMEDGEKIEQSEIAKTKGNNYFKDGHYSQAIRFYKKIADFLGDVTGLEGEEKEKRDKLLLAAYLNHAQCDLKLHQYNNVCDNCEKALEVNEKSEKAYFRRGQAKLAMKEHEEAIIDFKKVLELDPNNKPAKSQIAVAQRQIKQEREKSKKIYGGMFDKFAAIDAKKEKDNPAPKKDEDVEMSNGNENNETSSESENITDTKTAEESTA